MKIIIYYNTTEEYKEEENFFFSVFRKGGDGLKVRDEIAHKQSYFFEERLECGGSI
jgi:hypothetical protein